MTLRMDDMNQKENTVKLSIQSLDFRMSFLEELAIQNIDILSQIKQTLSQFDARSRNMSSSSRGSSRVRLDSEDSGNDQVDVQQYEDRFSNQNNQTIAQKRRREFSQSGESEKSLTPEVNATMKSMPSPILVHSHKAMQDDSLQRYTDFSKSSPKPTAPKPSTSISRRIDRQSSIKHRRSLPKLLERSPEMETRVSRNSLLERRHGNIAKLHLNTYEVSSSSTTHDDSTNVHNANINATGSSVYSTAHMDTATSVSTQQPAQIESSVVSSQPSSVSTVDFCQYGPIQIDIPASESYFIPTSYSSSMHTAPLTSILTSRSAEYTTITDEIDTSCVMTHSPPRSPTSAIPYSSANEPGWEDVKLENPASKSEKAALKRAEEMEHRKMEKVIRNRLRQISMDESDSISDIAKLVISEMENEVEYAHSDHEDDEDLHGSSEDIRSEDIRSEDIRSESVSEQGDEKEEQADSGPITFEAAANVEIRIRRASTLDEEMHPPPNC